MQQGGAVAAGTCGRHGLHAHGVLAAHLHGPDLRSQGPLGYNLCKGQRSVRPRDNGRSPERALPQADFR